MTKLPSGPNKNQKPEAFGGLIKSMNDFFQEKPVKGFLQSIDDFFKTPFPFASSTFTLDVTEKEREHIIKAELPGVKREQIEIDIINHFVTVSVLNHEAFTETDEHNHTYRKSQSIQKSSRSVSLPHPINEKNVKASYKDGLLQIRIPKQTGKRINIED